MQHAHPGAILRDDVLPRLNVTVAKAAVQLGVHRVTLSRLLHEHAQMTPDMAARLELWHPGRTAEEWLRLQAAHDLERVQLEPATVTPAYVEPWSAV